MLHLIAFIVIGIVLGVLAALPPLGGRGKNAVVAVVGGLIGGLVGGELLFHVVSGSAGKYGSIVLAIILAAVLAWVGRGIGASSQES